jgi:hypothetical protein
MTKRTYYSLVVWEDDAWAQQFGDYSRKVVRDELEDYRYSLGYRRDQLRILATGDEQADIDAAVAQLNADAQPVSMRLQQRWAKRGS